ncbi:MAG: aminopeptidase [Bacteroidota bacterium]|jgi:hypothetical protein|nr:aminopeptidase [Bacteroidota bacterium]
MKKLYCLFFSLISLGLSSQNNSYNTTEEISCMEAKAHANMFRSVQSGAQNTYDINYHRCEWNIDPGVRYIKGAITTYFKPTTSNFNSMQFDLQTSLTIDSILYHNILLTYTQTAPALLQINLPGVLPMSVLDSITVFYQGVPPVTGFGSYENTTHGTAATPITWTLSEPFGAQDWWPCKQDLNDKIDSIDIIVETPQAYRVASNGVLVSELQSGINKFYHWKSRHRIAAYLIAIAITDYAVYSDFVPLSATDSIEVLNYVYPEDLVTTQLYSPDIINTIKLFDSLTIVYPFADEKYGHAQFGWGGGMEHQTMSFVVGFNHGLLAHECAHQWFGDHVTCGSWQDIWLNEGFATYFEGLTEERYFPSTWQTWKQDKINHITSNPGGSVLCDDTTSVGRIFDGRLSYNKGAYLVHMLRWKLGDSVFFAGLKNYLTAPGIAANYAKTQDLKAILESTSGQNLTNFFNQWYYNQGYPSYQVGYTQNLNTLNVIITQTQSHPSVSFFEMPVPIKFTGAGQDTTIVFDNTYSGQTFTTTLDFPIISAQFDPELWILSKNNTIIGIEERPGSFNNVSVYPNPASDKLSLMFDLKSKEDVRIDLFDISGRLALSKTFSMNTGKSTESLDLSGINSGVYQLQVLSDSFSHTQKLIKK